MISPEHFSEIIKQMRSFRESNFLCDIVLVTNERNFRAHSVVLAAASTVFRETFKQNGVVETIHLTGFDASTVEIALEIMYGGELNLPFVYMDSEKLQQLFTSLQDLGLDSQKLQSCQITFLG